MTTITIPKELTKKGDLVIVPRQEYEKLCYIFKIIPRDQWWFWTKEWQKKEKKATEDIKKGRIYGPFTNANDLIKSLRSKRE